MLSRVAALARLAAKIVPSAPALLARRSRLVRDPSHYIIKRSFEYHDDNGSRKPRCLRSPSTGASPAVGCARSSPLGRSDSPPASWPRPWASPPRRIPPSQELSHAGLVSSRREGAPIVYCAAYPALSDLIAFLMKDVLPWPPGGLRPGMAALTTCCRHRKDRRCLSVRRRDLPQPGLRHVSQNTWQ